MYIYIYIYIYIDSRYIALFSYGGAQPPSPIISNIWNIVPEAPNPFILVQLSFLYMLDQVRFEGHL